MQKSRHDGRSDSSSTSANGCHAVTIAAVKRLWFVKEQYCGFRLYGGDSAVM